MQTTTLADEKRTDEELMEALRSTLPREDGLVVLESPAESPRWPAGSLARVTHRSTDAAGQTVTSEEFITRTEGSYTHHERAVQAALDKAIAAAAAKTKKRSKKVVA